MGDAAGRRLTSSCSSLRARSCSRTECSWFWARGAGSPSLIGSLGPTMMAAAAAAAAATAAVQQRSQQHRPAWCTSAPPPCHPIVHCRQGQSRQCRLTQVIYRERPRRGKIILAERSIATHQGQTGHSHFQLSSCRNNTRQVRSTNIPLRCVAPAPRLPSPRPAAPALAQLHASSEVLQPPARRRAPGSGGRTLPPPRRATCPAYRIASGTCDETGILIPLAFWYSQPRSCCTHQTSNQPARWPTTF
jgi:hypothetical protein